MLLQNLLCIINFVLIPYSVHDYKNNSKYESQNTHYRDRLASDRNKSAKTGVDFKNKMKIVEIVGPQTLSVHACRPVK